MDVRLIVGVLLVAASVAGVVAIVTAADRRITVYAAGDTFAPGDLIDAGDLQERSVAFEGAASFYLMPGDIPKDGLIVSGIIRDGELVPRAAVGSRVGEDSTAIVVELAAMTSSAVVAGALIDIWAATAAAPGDLEAAGEFGAPSVIASDAIVVRVLDDDQLVSAGNGQSVEVLIPRSRVARLLQALANGDALAVVPAGLPLGALDGESR